MSKNKVSTDETVFNLFQELVGERAGRLRGISNKETRLVIAEALEKEFPEKTAKDIAFHLADWNSEAAFIVAMHLFPERFTKEQIRSGVGKFIVHAPNHVAAAAKLADQPVEDIFEVGALDGRPEE
jgi:hypothetical protein